MTQMIARYPGECTVCGKPFRAGTTIDYDRATRDTRHIGCEPFVPPPDAVRLSEGEGYGGRAYRVGQVLRDPRTGTACVVLHATAEYISRDAMSFGVGLERGYLYSAWARPATADEAAPLVAREQQQRARLDATRLLQRAARYVEQHGERLPMGSQYPADRETLADGHTVTGGGTCWLVADGALWYVEYHGGDGDAWDTNNLPGAIGWRLSDPDGAHAAHVRQALATLAAPVLPAPAADDEDEED